MAGYSKTPLATKLGIKKGHRIAVINGPPGFTQSLGPLPDGAILREDGRASAFDVVIFFTHSRAELVERFPALARRLCPAGGLWISWPKKTSGVATDLTEDRVREIGLTGGLVDNKVCAVDETWSGLRFVFRLKDRPAAQGRFPK
jgi:hypothetical protein